MQVLSINGLLVVLDKVKDCDLISIEKSRGESTHPWGHSAVCVSAGYEYPQLHLLLSVGKEA